MSVLERAVEAVQNTVVGCCNPNEREAAEIARAVLMAVREPDDVSWLQANEIAGFSFGGQRELFTAMIDAILADKPA